MVVYTEDAVLTSRVQVIDFQRGNAVFSTVLCKLLPGRKIMST